MAESRQQKARRLVIEHYNKYFQASEDEPADPDKLGIFWTQPLTEKNWIIVMLMKEPVRMYWEVHYSKKDKTAEVRPFGPMPQGSYPDSPPAQTQTDRKQGNG